LMAHIFKLRSPVKTATFTLIENRIIVSTCKVSRLVEST